LPKERTKENLSDWRRQTGAALNFFWDFHFWDYPRNTTLPINSDQTVLLERSITAQSKKFQIFFQKRFGGISSMVNIIVNGLLFPNFLRLSKIIKA